METKTLTALQAAGVDTAGALSRFMGNAALYERFLRKFPADENYAKIGSALEAGDYDTVLTAAHTLKGVAGNLGMTRLFQASAEIVDQLRAGAPEQAREAYTALQEAYTAVMTTLIAEGMG